MRSSIGNLYERGYLLMLHALYLLGKTLPKRNDDGPPVWIQFRYERIADLCHMYGIITQFIVQCNALEPACIALGDGARFYPYGYWLKANLRLHASIALYIRECIFQGTNMSNSILRIESHADDSSMHTQRLQHLQNTK